MSRTRLPEDVVREFWAALTETASHDGWSLGRLMKGHFSRGFTLAKGDKEIHLKVRVSQLKKGFWELPFGEAAAIVAGKKEYNVLLPSAYAGYVVSPMRLPALLARFSRSEA